MSHLDRPLRIAYATIYDSKDVRAWSGSGFHIAEALIQQGQEILRIGPLERYCSWWMRMHVRVAHRLTGRFHLLENEPAVLDHFAVQVQHALRDLRADVVLSPGIQSIAHLTPEIPQVVWTDTTFAGLVDAYPEFTGLTAAAVAQGHAAERRAFANRALSIYTSHWARDGAMTHYQQDSARLAVVPFGANITHGIADSDLERRVAERLAAPPRLLFVGVDWQRKGGPQILDVLRALRTKGINAHLTVIGCTPTIPDDLRTVVEVLGFISKQDPVGRARLNAEFDRACLHILMSAHECFGLVLCEACAHGVPSVTTTTEGIPTIIHDGVNGLADPVGTSATAIADRVRALLENPDAYGLMCRAALASFHSDFNWKVAGRRVVELLQSAVTRSVMR